MITSNNIINYRRTDAELEELILFLVLTVGKGSERSARALDSLLGPNSSRPFDYIRELISRDRLRSCLEAVKTGQYARVERSFRELSGNYSGSALRSITIDELESLHGIGMKSSRCFICWTRPDAEYAMLDTHIMAELRELGFTDDRKTPSSRSEYLRLEKIFLELAETSGLTPAAFDLQIWNRRSGRKP